MQTREEIERNIDLYNLRIGSYTISDEGLIDVDGNVEFTNTELEILPLQFGKVTGDFDCYLNQLTTLKGTPYSVGGSFNCFGNKLDSLEFSPTTVGSDFVCYENKLTSLKGIPNVILGNCDVNNNELKSLVGGPEKVAGSYYILNNKLTALDGNLNYVGGVLCVSGNPLISLIGCPKFIGDALFFDDTTRFEYGNQNCEIKRIVITFLDIIPKHKNKYRIPEIVKQYGSNLPLALKFSSEYALYDYNGIFNLENFMTLMNDIKDGLADFSN